MSWLKHVSLSLYLPDRDKRAPFSSGSLPGTAGFWLSLMTRRPPLDPLESVAVGSGFTWLRFVRVHDPNTPRTWVAFSSGGLLFFSGHARHGPPRPKGPRQMRLSSHPSTAGCRAAKGPRRNHGARARWQTTKGQVRCVPMQAGECLCPGQLMRQQMAGFCQIAGCGRG